MTLQDQPASVARRISNVRDPPPLDEGDDAMAVMVSFTLKADKATYLKMHGQFLPVAKAAGLLFHSSREVGGQVGIVDFWPSEAAWQSFSGGPLANGLKSAGIALPDDLVITPVINADGK